MRMKKKKIIKKLPFKSYIVAVKRNLSAKAKFYSVFDVQAYIDKCKKEGKIAYFVGISNEKGELIL